jgi:AcrR family transcriptional regulator
MLELSVVQITPNLAERADAASNRQHILQIARGLFASKGVAAVNMASIAHFAQVGKGTLYRRFAHKGELCLALLDANLQAFQNLSLATLQLMHQQNASYRHQLEWFLQSTVSYTLANEDYFCEIQRSPLGESGHFAMPHFWLYQTVRGLFCAAQRAGELPAGLDANFWANALLAPLSAQNLRVLRKQFGYTQTQIQAALISLLPGHTQP